MQYAGQLNDIEVAADADDPEDVDALVSAFEDAYARLYAGGARSPELGYAITSVVVIGSAPVEKPALPVESPASGPATTRGERDVWWTETGGHVRSAVHEQDAVRAGQTVTGPAIVESPSATLAVPPGRVAELDTHRIFHLRDA
jgi:acetone carboxylase beta subunit